MSRRPKHPTPDDLRLWHEVAKSVTPIGRPLLAAVDDETLQRNAEAPVATAGRGGGASLPRREEPRRPDLPKPATLDRRLSGKVARGRVDIDARIDLHGMTQAIAHSRLAGFLHHAQAEGHRLVLVITGKGGGDKSDSAGEESARGERGVLRRQVPRWLDGAELRPFVVGFGAASRRHGGEGALYVHIRRRRD